MPCAGTVIVVDAFVLAVALADDDEDGVLARTRLHGETLAAPEVIELEVLSVWRGLVRSKQLTARRAEEALEDLLAIPISRAAHRALAHRIWELRENLTPYDAAYVALAEALDVTLVTADSRLSRASGPRCDIEVLPVPR